jgi:hypothetical protein
MRAPEGVSESNKGSQNAGNATDPTKTRQDNICAYAPDASV